MFMPAPPTDLLDLHPSIHPSLPLSPLHLSACAFTQTPTDGRIPPHLFIDIAMNRKSVKIKDTHPRSDLPVKLTSYLAWLLVNLLLLLLPPPLEESSTHSPTQFTH